MSKWIKYVGTADRRVISVADWEKKEISAPAVVWDKSNGWVADISKLPDEAQEDIMAGRFFVEVQEPVAKADLTSAKRMRAGSRRTKADRERVELPSGNPSASDGRGGRRGGRAEVPQ